MKYSGVDLHSNNSVVTVTDDTDRVVAEKRLPNDIAKIVGFLLPWRDELAGVVVESTYNWYWLVDGLIEAGHSVHLANTVAIKQYDGLKYRGDESDARHLAHILRLGLLPEGHIMSQPLRALRDPVAQEADIDKMPIGGTEAIGVKANLAVMHALQTANRRHREGARGELPRQCGIQVAQDRARNRSNPGHSHPAGDGRYQSLRRRRELCIVLPLRQ